MPDTRNQKLSRLRKYCAYLETRDFENEPGTRQLHADAKAELLAILNDPNA